MRAPGLLLLALSLLLPCSCGDGDGEVRALRQRVAELEAKTEAQAARLRQHGIDAAAPDGAATPVAQSIGALEQALDDLDSAKDTLDTARGRRAMQAIDAAVQRLAAQPALALPALLAAAKQAPAPRQPAVLECYARVGGAAVAPELQALLADPAAAAALRQQAGRSLLACDAGAGIAAVQDLLRGRIAALPEPYLLVYLLAETRDERAVPVLLEALKNQDRSVRCHAATGLANFRGQAVADALATAAGDDEFGGARANALRALQKVDAARAAAVATRLERDPDGAVRAAAQAAVR